MEKVKFHRFLKADVILKESDQPNTNFIIIRVRINPIMISFYNESENAEVDGKVYKTTSVIVDGKRYLLALPIEEVDEMIENMDGS